MASISGGPPTALLPWTTPGAGARALAVGRVDSPVVPGGGQGAALQVGALDQGGEGDRSPRGEVGRRHGRQARAQLVAGGAHRRAVEVGAAGGGGGGGVGDLVR